MKYRLACKTRKVETFDFSKVTNQGAGLKGGKRESVTRQRPQAAAEAAAAITQNGTHTFSYKSKDKKN